jgi:peptide chain release factor 3
VIKEIERRRTLAIISHPDAGKTTLTEKLLLYGGALELAGSVTAKKKQRDTASDWMELEKKRGISISSTVLQFDYSGYKFNLLDTPGHKDFSEDTYRVLTAVDGVIMVIDAAKGIESQTIKLFEICKKRNIPIFTFINKLDRPGKSPIELLDQIEEVLGLKTYPLNWPIDSGEFFKGVYDRQDKEVHLFQRSVGGAFKAPVSVHSLTDDSFKNMMDQRVYNEFMSDIDLLDNAHFEFDMEEIKRGELTPIYFGSAYNNFGIELLLKGFLKYSSVPLPREMSNGEILPVESEDFSAFIFKIQTNMNPMHRDRMVFARICSGKFERNTKIYNTRTKKEIRLSSVHSIFGKEREIVEESYPGDIIGFITNVEFGIGDTISTNANIKLKRIPQFAPEIFSYVNNVHSAKYKSFRKGLDHLIAENVVQTFDLNDQLRPVPLLGALGDLQFEVLQHRLKEEYGVESSLESTQWSVMRWIKNPEDLESIKSKLSYNGTTAVDSNGRQVVLFKTQWNLTAFVEKNPEIELLDFLVD